MDDSEAAPSEVQLDTIQQGKLLRLLVVKPEYRENYLSHIPPSLFREPLHRKVFDLLVSLAQDPSSKAADGDTVKAVLDSSLSSQEGLSPEYRQVFGAKLDQSDWRLLHDSVKGVVKRAISGALLQDGKVIDRLLAGDISPLQKVIDSFEAMEQEETAGFGANEAKARFNARPRSLYPTPWPEMDLKEGTGLPAGSCHVMFGNTSSGKSLYKMDEAVMYLSRGHPVLLAEFENDLEDIYVDMAVRILGEKTLPSMTPQEAADHVGAYAKAHCGSADAFRVLEMEDTVGGARHIIKACERAEKRAGIKYQVVLVDGLGDMRDLALEKELGNEWRAQTRMFVSLKKWCKEGGRLLSGSIQGNRDAERAEKDGGNVGMDQGAGSINFAKKATVYTIVVPGVGLKVKKWRLNGSLKGRMIHYEYRQVKVGVNARGFVRLSKPFDIRSVPAWVGAKAKLAEALRGRADVEPYLSGVVSICGLVVNYESAIGLPTVQAGLLLKWLHALRAHIADTGVLPAGWVLSPDDMIEDLKADGVVSHKADSGGKKHNVLYYLKIQKEAT